MIGSETTFFFELESSSNPLSARSVFFSPLWTIFPRKWVSVRASTPRRHSTMVQQHVMALEVHLLALNELLPG